MTRDHGIRTTEAPGINRLDQGIGAGSTLPLGPWGLGRWLVLVGWFLRLAGADYALFLGVDGYLDAVS